MCSSVATGIDGIIFHPSLLISRAAEEGLCHYCACS
jgi:hypothetical protein